MDTRIQEIDDYIAASSSKMQQLTLASTGLVEKTVASARIFNSFSEVCMAISSNSDEEYDDFMRQFGLSMRSYSINMSRNADEQLVKVKEPLEQQNRMLSSIKSTVRRQKSLKQNFVKCGADQVLCEKMEQKDPNNKYKVDSSQNSKEALLKAKEEYTQASDALLDSFEKVKGSRMYEIVGIATAMCNLEIESCEKNGHVLADIYDELCYDDMCN